MEKLVPITRLGKFFGGEDYTLDIGMGEEWLLGDMNFTLILYRIDRYKTKIDDVYGEVINGGIQFQPPVEFRALVRIEEATNQYINGSRVMQNEPGNMTFSVYHKELEELAIDIKVGDYIGYWINPKESKFYSVTNAAQPNYDNKHTYGGYKSFYFSYTATPVSTDEFNGI